MKGANDALGIVNLVAFAALAAVAIRQWWTRRNRAAGWIALAFAALGFVAVVGRVLPDHPHGFAEEALQRILLALLLLFPYLLYRFTTAFGRPRPLWSRLLTSLTAALVVWTFALPSVPAAGEPRPGWFIAYLSAFVLHWGALSIVVAWRLYDAGRGQPSVARRRMRMLAAAAAAITLTIVLLVFSGDPDSGLALVASITAFVSALGFYLGLAPPAAVRYIWRRPEQARLQEAIAQLMTLATSGEGVVGRGLAPMGDIVGARAVAVRDADGQVVGTYNMTTAEAESAAAGSTII